MYARVTTYPTTALKTARERCESSNVSALPWMTSMTGCRGTLVLSDPMTGRVQTVSFWDTDEDLIASNGFHRMLARRVVCDAGLTAGESRTQIFEVVASDLPGPVDAPLLVA